MNRRITRTAALALLGTALLAPGTAHANIVITADSTGAPVESGDSGYLGQPLTLSGSGCTDGGMPTYLGQFSSMMGDPLLHPSMQPFEAQADEDGSVVWDFVIPLDNTLGEFHARWYCSTAPVESIDDPNMLWVGPVSTMTISNGVEPNGAQPNAMATSGALRNAGGTSTITFDQDPDGLPLVDKIEIPGEIAAELKAQVDERSETIGQVQRMYEIFLGRRADPQGLEFWEREAQTRNIKGIANRMANSPEYKRKFADTTDEQFLERVYQTALDRDPDPSGWDHWLQALGSKRVQRVELAMNFANSPEFMRRTAHTNYVITAFQVASPGPANPTIDEIDAFAARLDAGELKVTVIEDIALTVADADWWIAQG